MTSEDLEVNGLLIESLPFPYECVRFYDTHMLYESPAGIRYIISRSPWTWRTQHYDPGH